MLSTTVSLVIFLVVDFTQGSVSVHNPFYCYSEDPIRPWTELSGIHSRYDAFRGQLIKANVSTCEPSKLWMLGRHGARFPKTPELPDLVRVVTDVHS